MPTRLIVPLDGSAPYEEEWDPTQEPGYQPPDNTPQPYRISKMTPWLRMTASEADIVYGAMTTSDARLRAIYDAAPFLQSNDALWPTMHDILANALSPERADELLAPET